MNKELLKHEVILGIYLLLGSAANLAWKWDLFWWWVGGVVGFALTYVDRLLYIYLLHPEEDLSLLVRDLVRKKRWKLVLKEIYQRRNEQVKLTTRSALFVLVWVGLAIFAVTSTGGLFARGLVMGLGLHMLYDFWRDQRVDPQVLNKKLFWQVKRVVNLTEQKQFLYFFTGMFILLTLVVI